MALVHVHVSVQTINEGSTVYGNKLNDYWSRNLEYW